ncbi:MAG TPA: DUF302 domain-containing protein [Thermoanaerobaculia bacterium]|nr:DUF302 domain-containing protein [Thermoanaerobaculia bacterium]
MQTTAYGIRRVVDRTYDDALTRTRAALAAEGFGILSEIDIKEKLKEKLGVDFKRYVILGACNPPLAHKALQAEPEIGLLLPCNVIVYEESAKRSVVAAIDPDSMVTVTGNARIAEIAKDAKARLERALKAI